MLKENENFVDAVIADDETPPWKRLDTVIRSWVIRRLHEEEQERYQEMRNASK